MTTAQLNVGINTEQAKRDLAELRKTMEGTATKLVISVDPTSVDRDIQRYLKQRTFKVSVNTRALGDEIANDVGIALDRAFARDGRKLAWNVAALRGGLNSAIDPIFNDSQRRLRFDRERLVTDLREAVTVGLTGGSLKLGAVQGAAGAAAAPQGLAPDLKTTIQRTLAPAVDELSKAALQIASVARKAGVSGGVGSPVAKESVSTKDPVTGFTKSYSRKLDNPELQLADIQVANHGPTRPRDRPDPDVEGHASIEARRDHAVGSAKSGRHQG
jgi:hypothetical protein